VHSLVFVVGDGAVYNKIVRDGGEFGLRRSGGRAIDFRHSCLIVQSTAGSAII
jgi:hypothetical protein